MTNEQLVKRYLQLCRSKGLAEKTINAYSHDLAVFLQYIGGKPLEQVTHIDIENFLFYCQEERKNGAHALNRKRNTLNSFFETLIRKDYLNMKNPMYKVDKIKTRSDRIKDYLTVDEYNKLMRYVEGLGDLRGLSYISLTYSSACRISEIRQLNRDSLDFENRIFVVFGKGEEKRPCIFSEEAKYWTLEYLESRKDDLPPLYLSRENKRWSKEAIERYIKKVVAEAGINKHITPHSLRHSVLTNMRLEGAPLEDLQLLAGHKNIQTTQKTYTHVGLLDIKNKFDKYYNKLR